MELELESESKSCLIRQSFDERYSRYAREALDELPDNFTITDPSIPGHPIVFASLGFLKMTGYTRDEVVGKNGAMFQGQGTCRRAVMEIREAIREERKTEVNLLNYRKDGTPFWMLFHMSPVFSNHGGGVVHFVAVQVPLRRKRRRVCGGSLCEDGSRVQQDFVFGCCRKEVCSDSLLELGRVCSRDQVLERDVRELESEEPCEASDDEKRSAVTAMDSIFSVLTHYSESTGRLVCRKRCSMPDVGLLSTSLIISLGRIKQSFVLPLICCLLDVEFPRRTNPHLPDMPIVYASDAFLKLTGYARDEVLGRNCRFLGGKNTDTSTSCLIRESIKTEQPCTVRILNYRKDKSSFWNLLHISPVRDASGKKVTMYSGLAQWKMRDSDCCVIFGGISSDTCRLVYTCHLENRVDVNCNLIAEVAYFVGVQIEDENKNEDRHGLNPQIRQLSVVGAVKVAVRSLSMTAGCSKS